jgi:hypothetical protein
LGVGGEKAAAGAAALQRVLRCVVTWESLWWRADGDEVGERCGGRRLFVWG